MTAQHTPGPWHPMMERDQTGFRVMRNFVQCGDDILATVYAMGDGNEIADTRLIAAAPDLLDALEALLNAERHSMHIGYDNGSGGGNYIYTDVIRCDDAAVDAARAAIAKATGGAA